MKIQPINNIYSLPKNLQNVNKQKYATPQKADISFGHAGMWNQFELDILKKSETEMKEIAKFFYKSTEYELKDVAKIRNFFGRVNEAKSERALQILKNAINSVIKDKESMEVSLNLLNEKKQHSILSEVEQRSLDYYKAQIEDFDTKFDQRRSKFYIEENLLTEEDINYFKRHDNDY